MTSKRSRKIVSKIANRIKFEGYDHHEALSLSYHVVDKLFHLVAMFHSSRRIAELALKDAKAQSARIGSQYVGSHPLERLRDAQFHSQATKLLTEIAIYMRIIDDRFKGEYPLIIDFTCGTLIRRSEKDTPLTMRDACNKIIHATSFEFTRQDVGDWHRYRMVREPLYFYLPLVSFYGTQGKKEWMAYLDVEKFCAVSSEVCRVTLF